MTVTNKHTPKQHNVSHLNTASLYPNLLPLSPSSQEIFFCPFFIYPEKLQWIAKQAQDQQSVGEMGKQFLKC